MRVPGADRAGKFVRKQKDAAVDGATKVARTATEMSGRGLDAAVSGSKGGLAGLSDLSSRAGSAAVEGSKAGATTIADAAVQGAAAAASGAQTAASGVVDATSRGLSVASEGGRRAMEFGRKSAADLLSVSQGVLASGLAGDLNAMLAKISAGPATLYDKAMDAEYLATSIGGGNHRMFDGGHTLAGAFEAVRGASAEDTILQEGFGYMQGLFRDLTTPMGLPLANWDKGTYDQVSGYLQSQFSIPKGWFYDINSFDAAEVLGAGVGVVAVFFCWNRADSEQFGRLAGSMGLSAALSANPLLLIVTIAALARAFHVARREGRAGDAVDGLFRGAVTAATSLAVVSAVAALGGPAGLALLVGLIAGMLAAKAVSRVSVVEVGQVVAEQARASARLLLGPDRPPRSAVGSTS
ncbi:MAG: hypothetical protein OXG35_01455 [Acidobacteria bacterium]|nr:hypothetical protein [Acidobacteriota bacterium]